ncbi:hypothetical protein [Methylocystis sp.]|uniref:hypothetical protein n=1 Tax=Methylocystis sp. TaxID=1911079 RepID=UPI00345C3143
MKLFSAAPCSFFSVARAAQSGAAGSVCAKAAADNETPAAKIEAVKILLNMLLSSKVRNFPLIAAADPLQLKWCSNLTKH